MVYGHRPHHRSKGETYREVLLQPAMRAVMPGDLEGSGDSPCFLGQYKRLLILNGSVEVLGFSLANISVYRACVDAFSNREGEPPSPPANVTSRGTLYIYRQFIAMNQLPTLTLQPYLFAFSAPEMPETSISTDGCCQRCPSRLLHCCALTWPRLWFRRKGNSSVEQNTAFLLSCIEREDLETPNRSLKSKYIICFDSPCSIFKRKQHAIDKMLFHFSIAENQ